MLCPLFFGIWMQWHIPSRSFWIAFFSTCWSFICLLLEFPTSMQDLVSFLMILVFSRYAAYNLISHNTSFLNMLDLVSFWTTFSDSMFKFFSQLSWFCFFPHVFWYLWCYCLIYFRLLVCKIYTILRFVWCYLVLMFLKDREWQSIVNKPHECFLLGVYISISKAEKSTFIVILIYWSIMHLSTSLLNYLSLWSILVNDMLELYNS